MAKFFKNLFTPSSQSNFNLNMNEEKKAVKEKKEPKDNDESREFTTPYDTKRKLSISRSGRMKQNLKSRGKLGGDLYGELPQKIEKTSIEYHVNKRSFFEDDSHSTIPQNIQIENRLDVPPSIEQPELVNKTNDSTAKSEPVNTIENNFKYLDSLDDENPSEQVYLEESKFKETNF